MVAHTARWSAFTTGWVAAAPASRSMVALAIRSPCVHSAAAVSARASVNSAIPMPARMWFDASQATRTRSDGSSCTSCQSPRSCSRKVLSQAAGAVPSGGGAQPFAGVPVAVGLSTPGVTSAAVPWGVASSRLRGCVSSRALCSRWSVASGSSPRSVRAVAASVGSASARGCCGCCCRRAFRRCLLLPSCCCSRCALLRLTSHNPHRHSCRCPCR